MEGDAQTPGKPQRQNVDTKSLLRQEQLAHGEKGEPPPETEIAPVEVKGWVVSIRILHNAERNHGDPRR